jgi:hypothetical protein
MVVIRAQPQPAPMEAQGVMTPQGRGGNGVQEAVEVNELPWHRSVQAQAPLGDGPAKPRRFFPIQGHLTMKNKFYHNLKYRRSNQ